MCSLLQLGAAGKLVLLLHKCAMQQEANLPQFQDVLDHGKRTQRDGCRHVSSGLGGSRERKFGSCVDTAALCMTMGLTDHAM